MLPRAKIFILSMIQKINSVLGGSHRKGRKGFVPSECESSKKDFSLPKK